MQGIQERLRPGLTDTLPFVSSEVFDLALNLVDLGNLLQRTFSDLAFVARMQVKEFSPGMRQATDFKHAVGQRLLVARVIVTNQAAFPIPQEGSSVFTRSGLAEILVGSPAHRRVEFQGLEERLCKRYRIHMPNLLDHAALD